MFLFINNNFIISTWIWWKKPKHYKNSFTGFIIANMGKVSRQSKEMVQWELAELEWNDSSISFSFPCLSGRLPNLISFWYGIITIANRNKVVLLKRKCMFNLLQKIKDSQTSGETHERPMWTISFVLFVYFCLQRLERLGPWRVCAVLGMASWTLWKLVEWKLWSLVQCSVLSYLFFLGFVFPELFC